MSTDDDPFADDKTVLRPSAKRPKPGGRAAAQPPGDDHTLMRPRPGGGREARGGAADAPPQPPPPPRAAPRREAPVRPAPRQPAPQAPIALRGSGLNPLVDAAAGLLGLVVQLRGTARNPDVGGLRSHVVQEMRSFEGEARDAGISNETVLSARYALCTVLDETVLSTPWGSESPWARQTLLSAFHKETWGGEKVFQILEHMLQAPARNIDFLELMYICLALGFEGKYRVLDGGRRQLEQIQDNLARAVRSQRPEFERELSPHWQGVTDRRNALVRYVPLWVVASLAGALLLALYVGFSFTLNAASDPVFARLQKIGRAPPPVLAVKAPATPVKPPAPKPPTINLRTFLAPEVRQGLVQVTEEQGRTTVVIRGDGLFGSGSAEIKHKVLPLIERIAEALKKVKGRVLVTGHTDNVPIRTIRFPSNWSLSQARAESVARRLESDGVDAKRIKAEGMGDTEPRASNATPAGRAKNRRVEIVLIAQGSGV